MKRKFHARFLGGRGRVNCLRLPGAIWYVPDNSTRSQQPSLVACLSRDCLCAARYAAWWCILVGYLATAIIIRIVDVCWIHYEMSRPGWDGTPDMDMVFAIGMFTRIGFVSLAMLPVSAAGIWLKRRHRLSHAHAIA